MRGVSNKHLLLTFYHCSMLFLCPILCCNHLNGKEREMASLLCLSSLCLVIVVWLLLVVPQVCLQFVIVVFPGHTHLRFLGLLGKPHFFSFLTNGVYI